MESDNKLFLLDAYALIYRAYYAFIKNPRICLLYTSLICRNRHRSTRKAIFTDLCITGYHHLFQLL